MFSAKIVKIIIIKKASIINHNLLQANEINETQYS